MAAPARFDDVRGTPLPIKGRLGMRDMTYDALVQCYRATTILFFVASLAALLMYTVGRNDFEHAYLILVIGTTCLLIGFAFLAINLWWLEPGLVYSPQLVHCALLFGGVGVSAALYGSGPDNFMIATVVYLQPLIFGCYMLKPAAAFTHIVLIALEFGLVLAVSPGVNHPVLQWVFLVGVGASGALVLGRLADATSSMAVAEFKARAALAEVNDTLERRVEEQVEQLERLGQLRRFLSSPVADAVAGGSAELLAPHRRAIAVFFCDMRGFTSFSTSAEPEDVVDVLGEYYRAVGHHLDAHKATVGSFAGDGVMAYFNDPLPVDNPALAALEMALALAADLDVLVAEWRRNGYELGYGIGITHGHATLGVVG